MSTLHELAAHLERTRIRRELTPTLNRLEGAAARGDVDATLVRQCLAEIDRVLPGPLGSESIRRPE